MYRVTVLYDHPQDPAEFERYYREVHLPLASKIKGITGFTTSKGHALDPRERPAYHRVASLYAESPEAMAAILGSPEGQAVVADLQNFATGGVTIVVGEEETLIPVSLPATPR